MTLSYVGAILAEKSLVIARPCFGGISFPTPKLTPLTRDYLYPNEFALALGGSAPNTPLPLKHQKEGGLA
jgi:hypothetical protein